MTYGKLCWMVGPLRMLLVLIFMQARLNPFYSSMMSQLSWCFKNFGTTVMNYSSQLLKLSLQLLCQEMRLVLP